MSTLSSVVSNLVRASMGSSVSPQVADDDLDRHVAELILKEAKKKAERFGQDGIRAYLRSGLADSNAPRTNKRFLTSIIRSTDDHNKTILQAQAQAAQELKRERDETERRERRARAEEAVEAEKLRRSRGEGSSRRRSRNTDTWDRWEGRTAERRRANDTEGWDIWDGRTAARPKRKPRDWETWTGDDDDEEDERDRDSRRHRSSRRHDEDDRHSSSKHSRRERDRSTRPSEHRRRHHGRSRRSSSRHTHSDDEQGSGDSRSHPTRTSSKERRRPHSPSPARSSATDNSRPRKRRRTASPSESRPSPRPSRRASPSVDKHDDVAARELELRKKLKSARDVSSIETSCKAKGDKSRSLDRLKSPEPALKRMKAALSSSRPRKTRAPSRSPTPGPNPDIQLPSKMDKYFEESYDPRLDIAPLTAPNVPATGLINSAEFEGWDAMLDLIRIRKEDREEKKFMERLGLTKDKSGAYKPVSSTAVKERWSGEGSNIMEIEYNKRGSVREWDMGKEGF
ncbi:hypothetical protein B0H15DRAFT_811392 [Mycena belliarum]|uniref:Uncharacterized protein n=1 Tax=Mycena belliarum TaxID=1033014 RepID=A0AAD6ULI4_9AGAR|nr:hypothetical protein B0H15DRAFT_811392 [Mycena belliae]